MFEIQKREAQSIKKWYRSKDEILFDPPYQRDGDLWPLPKQKLLIDTIINKFDLPKFYFHDLFFGKFGTNPKSTSKQTNKRYAVIDGKQRLSILFAFMDDKIPLAEDFEYQKDPKLSPRMQGMKYSDLKRSFPELIEDFDTFTLDVVYVLTNEEEKIEEIFLRLNEGTPVNAQEKRLARSSEYRDLIAKVHQEISFDKIVKFSDTRKAHSEAITKLLLLEKSKEEVCDLKKTFLDEYVENVTSSKSSFNGEGKLVVRNLQSLSKALGGHKVDSKGLLPVYYVFHKQVSKLKGYEDSRFGTFIKEFEQNLKVAKNEIRRNILKIKSDPQFVEFNRLNQQGTNDAGSILSRTQILLHYYKSGFTK